MRQSLSSVSRPSATRSPQSSRTRPASSPSQPVRRSQAAKSKVFRVTRCSSSRRPAPSTKPRHSCLRVVADVGRVAQRLGLLGVLAHVQRVDDQDAIRATRAISRTARATSAKWCAAVRHATRSKLAVGERHVLGAADHVGVHARSRVAGDDLEPGLAQPPRHVAAAGGDVERGPRALRPRDEQVEVVALPMRVRVDVQIRPVRPDVRHAASSTARLAASSIVGST